MKRAKGDEMNERRRETGRDGECLVSRERERHNEKKREREKKWKKVESEWVSKKSVQWK